MKLLNGVSVAMVSLMLFSANVIAQPDHEEISKVDSLMVNGIWRKYEYHIPQFPVENPKLLIVLRSGTYTSEDTRAFTNYEFNRLADKNGNTIVVYPHLPYFSSYHGSMRHTGAEKIKKPNHVDFVQSIIRCMEKRYGIDRKSVFAAAYSNEAHICLRLARVIPKEFIGFAIVGTDFSKEKVNEVSTDFKAVPFLFISPTAKALQPTKVETIPETIVQYFYQLSSNREEDLK